MSLWRLHSVHFRSDCSSEFYWKFKKEIGHGGYFRLLNLNIIFLCNLIHSNNWEIFCSQDFIVLLLWWCEIMYLWPFVYLWLYEADFVREISEERCFLSMFVQKGVFEIVWKELEAFWALNNWIIGREYIKSRIFQASATELAAR